MDTFVRLTNSGVVSIAKIRGCVRGVSSEFVRACDMRFASLENTRLANLKSAWECIPAAAVNRHPRRHETVLRDAARQNEVFWSK